MKQYERQERLLEEQSRKRDRLMDQVGCFIWGIIVGVAFFQGCSWFSP